MKVDTQNMRIELSVLEAYSLCVLTPGPLKLDEHTFNLSLTLSLYILFWFYGWVIFSMSILIFQGTHENPELIWNDESREKVSETVKKLKNRYMTISEIHICTNCKTTEVKIKSLCIT